MHNKAFNFASTPPSLATAAGPPALLGGRVLRGAAARFNPSFVRPGGAGATDRCQRTCPDVVQTPFKPPVYSRRPHILSHPN